MDALTLAVKDISAEALPYSHAQIDVETNSGDAHACILLVRGQQIRVIVSMMVMTMTGMASRLRAVGGRHGGSRGGEVSYAMGRPGPIEPRREHRRARRFCKGAGEQDATLDSESGRGAPGR